MVNVLPPANHLRAISPATVEGVLTPARRAVPRRGRSTTPPDSWLNAGSGRWLRASSIADLTVVRARVIIAALSLAGLRGAHCRRLVLATLRRGDANLACASTTGHCDCDGTRDPQHQPSTIHLLALLERRLNCHPVSHPCRRMCEASDVPGARGTAESQHPRAVVAAPGRAASAAHSGRPAPFRGRREMSRRRAGHHRRVSPRETPSMRANRGGP